MLVNTILILMLTLFVQNSFSQIDNRSQEDDCVLEHDGQHLHEGDIIESKNKVYKVEDCQLHRAYHVCGPHIMFIVNIVCQAVERYATTPKTTKRRYSRFVQQKLLTEACCQTLCTISEMTRYCP